MENNVHRLSDLVPILLLDTMEDIADAEGVDGIGGTILPTEHSPLYI